MSYIVDITLQALVERVKSVLGVAVAPVFEPANAKFNADYALPCFGMVAELEKNPAQIAQQVATELQDAAGVAKAEAVGGFVNVWLGDDVLAQAIDEVASQADAFGQQPTYAGKQVVVEHTDPNPFKEFHIGHTYTNTVGEAVGRLYKAGGADVHQVLYYGDVGRHIAMAIWGVQSLLATGEGDWYEAIGPGSKAMTDVSADKRVAFLGAAYVYGAQAFAKSEQSQEEIKTINKHIYDQDDEAIIEALEIGKIWSLEYFDEIYKRLRVGFERSYPESEVTEEGVQIVRDNMGEVFVESDGAVVYHGKTADLHTRVFINNRGLPTYEAKDIGLIYAKLRDYPKMDISHVITGNEQHVYYLVVTAAVAEIDPELAAKMHHTGHGMVKLSGGKKMSSRTGQVIKAVDILDELYGIIAENYSTKAAEDVMLGALKYAYLKHRIGGDVIFDINESVSLEGNSGPYIQYAHARGRSILAKLPGASVSDLAAGGKDEGDKKPAQLANLTPDERALATKIIAYTGATHKAVAELAPHHICTYLYELTQQFNRFYEKNRIVGDERQDVRAHLTMAYCQVLKNGLTLLNIPAPERL